MKILVLGLGNDLYGDDGVGLHAVRQLKKELEAENKFDPDINTIDFLECSLSGLALLDVVLGYDALVIVDTIQKPDPVTGSIHLLNGSELRDIPGPSPHYVSVPQTIEIGRRLGLKVPAIVKIIAVEAKNIYNLGEGLSEEMKRCIPNILENIKIILNDL